MIAMVNGLSHPFCAANPEIVNPFQIMASMQQESVQDRLLKPNCLTHQRKNKQVTPLIFDFMFMNKNIFYGSHHQLHFHGQSQWYQRHTIHLPVMSHDAAGVNSKKMKIFVGLGKHKNHQTTSSPNGDLFERLTMIQQSVLFIDMIFFLGWLIVFLLGSTVLCPLN